MYLGKKVTWSCFDAWYNLDQSRAHFASNVEILLCTWNLRRSLRLIQRCVSIALKRISLTYWTLSQVHGWSLSVCLFLQIANDQQSSRFEWSPFPSPWPILLPMCSRLPAIVVTCWVGRVWKLKQWTEKENQSFHKLQLWSLNTTHSHVYVCRNCTYVKISKFLQARSLTVQLIISSDQLLLWQQKR